MRAVVDTNVLVSGLFWRGPPHIVLEHVRSGRLTLVTFLALLGELADVLRRPKFKALLAAANMDVPQILASLREVAEIVEPNDLPARVSRDPDDEAVLAAAVTSSADVVISGDDDLVSIGAYVGIPIRTAAAFLAIFV